VWACTALHEQAVSYAAVVPTCLVAAGVWCRF
jgi:hypothetical protein